jgi:hypothetical protein
MELLPRGATHLRNKMLFELGLHAAASPRALANNTRQVGIYVGTGSGDQFRPWLRMADGSPLLAHSIAAGDLDVSFMNPASLLTQAYRGTGLFKGTPLPVRVIACYPSWDRYLHIVHPRTGLSSMAQLKAERYPLRVSIREDATHSTRYLLDQILALYDFTLDDIVAWGGQLQLVASPFDPRRVEALHAGEIDAIFDEGIRNWLDPAYALGWRALTFEEPVLTALEGLGWRRASVPPGGPGGRDPHVHEECLGLDYGGWPLYTRADLPDDDVYLLCDALAARNDEIPWDRNAYTGLDQLFRDTPATPLDVPLHPAAAQWARDQGLAVKLNS